MGMKEKIHGIVVPLVTPLETPERIDEIASIRMIDRVIAGGVHAIFLLGSTGEGPALVMEEKKRFLSVCVKAAAGRCPVLAGISGASFAEAKDLGQFAAELGVDAAVAAVPCFFPPQEEEIINYYQLLVREVPLPLFVYNMPSLTKVAMKFETVLRLAEMPNVIGYKDSSGDMEAFRRILGRLGGRSDFSLLIGPEELTAEAMELGGDGGVNGGANLRPELYANLYEAVCKKDKNKTAQLNAEVLKIVHSYGEPPTTGGVIRRLKYELSREGIIQNILAAPSLPMGTSVVG